MNKEKYKENQIPWKDFEEVVKSKQMQTTNGSMCIKEIELRIQIEILKELQYLNSK